MKRLLLLIISLCLISCDGGEKKTGLPKALDFNSKTTVENPSELFETKYIKLETNDNCFIRQVTRIASTNKYIFIIDYNQKRVLAFDHNGKYIGDVGREGKGPEEYNAPTRFFIDEQNGYIAIIDAPGRKINRYNLTDNFEFISSSQVRYRLGDMEATKNGNIICKNTNNNNIDEISKKEFLVLDNNLDVIDTLVNREFISKFGLNPGKSVYKNSGDIFGYSRHKTIVYKLTENEAIPFYTLSFGEETIPPISFYQSGIGENFQDFLNIIDESGYICFFSIYETNKSLFTQFGTGFSSDDLYVGFWDKKTDKTYCYEKEDFTKQMNIGASYGVLGAVSDYFVDVLDLLNIMEEKENGAKINEELNELLKNSKDSDNPILFMFKFK